MCEHKTLSPRWLANSDMDGEPDFYRCTNCNEKIECSIEEVISRAGQRVGRKLTAVETDANPSPDQEA